MNNNVVKQKLSVLCYGSLVVLGTPVTWYSESFSQPIFGILCSRLARANFCKVPYPIVTVDNVESTIAELCDTVVHACFHMIYS